MLTCIMQHMSPQAQLPERESNSHQTVARLHELERECLWKTGRRQEVAGEARLDRRCLFIKRMGGLQGAKPVPWLHICLSPASVALSAAGPSPLRPQICPRRRWDLRWGKAWPWREVHPPRGSVGAAVAKGGLSCTSGHEVPVPVDVSARMGLCLKPADDCCNCWLRTWQGGSGQCAH